MGSEDGKLIFAMSASPGFDVVRTGKTEEAKGDIFVSNNDLAQTICIRITGEF
jgi:hypothetical protein